MSSTAAIRFARHSAALVAEASSPHAAVTEASTVDGIAAGPDRVEIVTHDDEAGMEALGTFVLEYDAEHEPDTGTSRPSTPSCARFSSSADGARPAPSRSAHHRRRRHRVNGNRRGTGAVVAETLERGRGHAS